MYTEPVAQNNFRSLPDTPPSQQAAKDHLESFIDENDHNIPYTEQPRAYGDGELRIGTYLALNEDIYSLGFASMLRNEIVDEAILQEEANHPQSADTVKQAIKTPKGDGKQLLHHQQFEDHDEFDSQIYEDEQRHQEWEAKMLKIYEERNLGRTTILIHVLITAFCQCVLVILLFQDVVGFNMVKIKSNYGVLTQDVSIIAARFICTLILHLSLQDEVAKGLELMKYAVNNRNSFLNYKKAFTMGFLQSIITVSVESVSVFIILQSQTT